MLLCSSVFTGVFHPGSYRVFQNYFFWGATSNSQLSPRGEWLFSGSHAMPLGMITKYLAK